MNAYLLTIGLLCMPASSDLNEKCVCWPAPIVHAVWYGNPIKEKETVKI